MAINFGEEKILKEAKFEINKDLQVKGYLDLISKGKINITGRLRDFNDRTINELKKERQQFPIVFKLKETLTDADNVWKDSFTANKPETVQDYLKYFEGTKQEIYSLQLFFDMGALSIVAYSKPYGGWRASVLDHKNLEI